MAKTLLTVLACVGASATMSACATAQKTGATANKGVRGGIHLASTGSSMVKTTVNETYNGFGNAIRSPLRDFNLMQEKVPVALMKAKSDVYDTTGLDSCQAVAEAIAVLDVALGPDVDTPRIEDQRTRSQRLASAAADSALSAARGAVDAYIPYRSVIKQVTGAKKYEKEVTRATLAGSVRRGFLKAIGMQQNCAWPAAPINFKPKPAMPNVQLASNTVTPKVDIDAGPVKVVQLVSVAQAQAQVKDQAQVVPAAPVAAAASTPAVVATQPAAPQVVPAAPAPTPAPMVVATQRALEPTAQAVLPAAPAAAPAPAIITLASAPAATSAPAAAVEQAPVGPAASALGFAGGGSLQLASSPGLR